MKRIALTLTLCLGATIALADDYDILDYDFIRSIDPLAQRDEWALLHQGKTLNATDFAPRYKWRWCYYFKDGEQLIAQPAYVGSMQTALRRLGYYCGPVNGVFTPQVSEAIARLQKNCSMRVTGTLTEPVRRALHLP
ncbi:MAG: peptidoglycan-binding domain-containing protein [Candidatus Udaeobacter sp.]